MINYIIIGILLLIAGAVVFYLVREKRRGVPCVGCPHAKACAQKHRCSCGSHSPNRNPKD